MGEWLERLKKWLIGWSRGGPHFIVGDPDKPYLLRWYIIPRNDWCCIYLHKFLRDDDQALHDHPWGSVSLLLWGRYIEHTPGGSKEYRAGSVIVRKAEHAHRIELPDGKPTWTLFVTGPRVREWGFHCPNGWVHWKDFVKADKPGEVGGGGAGMTDVTLTVSADLAWLLAQAARREARSYGFHCANARALDGAAEALLAAAREAERVPEPAAGDGAAMEGKALDLRERGSGV